MNDNTKKPTASELAEAALANVYVKPAKVIAKGCAALAKAAGTTWDGFKEAVIIGLDAGHNDDTAFRGLSLACKSQDVPKGTWNRYSPIARKVYKAIQAGEMSRDDLSGLSVADAEARFPRKANKRTANKAEPVKAAPQTETEAMPAGSADMIEGDSERSRLLAEVNSILVSMTEDDLTAVLDMLREFTAPQQLAA